MVVPSMAFFISGDLLIAKVGNSFFTFVHFYFTLNNLFLSRSIPQLLTAAPTGSLKLAPECRFREAYSHLLQSIINCVYSPSFCRNSYSGHTLTLTYIPL